MLLIAGCVLLLSAGAFPRSTSAGAPKPAPKRTSEAKEDIDPEHCGKCHSEEVSGFARSAMAHSMRLAGTEPAGVVTAASATLQILPGKEGTWQEIRTASGETSRHRVDYVVGSGAHAQGYLSLMSDHLFQSPVAYYTKLARYGPAPGFESLPEPDFSRPVSPACLFCHAGGVIPVLGTQNTYRGKVFSHLSITCDRCHGSTVAHLEHPAAKNIVNPAHLAGAARDSVCEQCHLIGAARVLNPGKSFADFRAGEPLESTFTVFRLQPTDGKMQDLRVISHSEELALSACARNSDGKLWCGTCHDPHNEPTEKVSFYRDRCLLCHRTTAFAPSHPASTSNCVGCHMPRRDAVDGGHTVFTDHRIQRAPQAGPASKTGELVAWREPADDLRERNLGIALVGYGVEQRSPHDLVRGYQMLASVQERFANDPELYSSIGAALLLGKQTAEAAKAYEIAAGLDPASASRQTSLGQAYLALGRLDEARLRLEQALSIDPLELDAAKTLLDVYYRTGDAAAAAALAARFSRLADLQASPQKQR